MRAARDVAAHGRVGGEQGGGDGEERVEDCFFVVWGGGFFAGGGGGSGSAFWTPHDARVGPGVATGGETPQSLVVGEFFLEFSLATEFAAVSAAAESLAYAVGGVEAEGVDFLLLDFGFLGRFVGAARGIGAGLREPVGVAVVAARELAQPVAALDPGRGLGGVAGGQCFRGFEVGGVDFVGEGPVVADLGGEDVAYGFLLLEAVLAG